jgi:hypothetical protein
VTDLVYIRLCSKCVQHTKDARKSPQFPCAIAIRIPKAVFGHQSSSWFYPQEIFPEGPSGVRLGVTVSPFSVDPPLAAGGQWPSSHALSKPPEQGCRNEESSFNPGFLTRK